MPLLVKHVLIARLAELLHVTDITKVVRRTIDEKGHRSSIRIACALMGFAVDHLIALFLNIQN